MKRILVDMCSLCPFQGADDGGELCCTAAEQTLVDLHHDAARPDWCPLEEGQVEVALDRGDEMS